MANPYEDILVRTKALTRGHFKRVSGRHTDTYVQVARAFENQEDAQRLGAALAQLLASYNASLVVSPALGGILPGYEVARALGLRHVYAERRDGVMTLRRGFAVQKGERALIVEDEVTTGSSVREVAEMIRASGGIVAAVGCIVDKSNGEVAFRFPFHALLTLKMVNYEPDACELCKRGEPLGSPRQA